MNTVPPGKQPASHTDETHKFDIFALWGKSSLYNRTSLYTGPNHRVSISIDLFRDSNTENGATIAICTIWEPQTNYYNVGRAKSKKEWVWLANVFQTRLAGSSRTLLTPAFFVCNFLLTNRQNVFRGLKRISDYIGNWFHRPTEESSKVNISLYVSLPSCWRILCDSKHGTLLMLK